MLVISAHNNNFSLIHLGGGSDVISLAHNFSALILQIVSHSWCSVERRLLFSGPDGKFRAFKGCIQNPPEQTDSVILHTETAEHTKQRPSFCPHRCTSWSFGLSEEGLHPGGCALPVGQRCYLTSGRWLWLPAHSHTPFPPSGLGRGQSRGITFPHFTPTQSQEVDEPDSRTQERSSSQGQTA